jgi:DNA invertase Pin-like site-specific DNA recombinase
MPKTILVIAETPATPSADEQRSACQKETDLVFNLGRVRIVDLPGELLKHGHILEPGDVLKVYDLSCFPMATSKLNRFMLRLLQHGVLIHIANRGLRIDGTSASDSHNLLAALNDHWIATRNAGRTEHNRSIGPKTKLESHQLNTIESMLAVPGTTVKSVADSLGIGRSTLFAFLRRERANSQ